MQERDTFPFGAESRRFVDESNTGGATTSQRTVEVVDGEADVMYARATVGDELADWRLGMNGFEELDERVAGGKSGNVCTIGIRELDFREAEEITIEWKDIVECAHGDPHVGDARCAAGNVGHISALVRRGAGAEY
jgi:hypothetical protein